jgi:hypothetical protein
VGDASVVSRILLRKVEAMISLVPSVAALGVTAIYCLWQSYHAQQYLRTRTLRERVAYMLWTAARLEA